MKEILIKQNNVTDAAVKELQNKYNVNKELAKFLLGRELTKDVLDALLGEYVIPKHDNITNIQEAANLIASFLEKDNSAIYIYADYDSDGVNAGTIAYDALSKIKQAINSNCHIEVHFPNRSEGYGLSLEWCKELVCKNKKENKEILVITVDNGITKRIETEYLLSNDIEVIITDHHHPKKGETPEDVLIIDPWLHKETDKDSLGLCGAGVAYKLFAYLLEEIYKDDSNYHLFYLPLVSIATITDIMPLTVENAQYLRYGFYLIENNYCSKAILYYKEYNNKQYLSTKEIAFGLGPELNACGRMLNTKAAGDFLLTEDDDNVVDLYNTINRINKERKKFQKEILDEIFDNLIINEDTRFIIAHTANTGGVGGVIAAKITEKYNLPCMVLSGEGDLLHGSARGLGDLDLQELFIQEVEKGNLLNFGGHKGAAGVYVHSSKINALQKSLNESLKDYIFSTEDTFDNTVVVDDVLTLADINKSKAEMTKDIPLIGALSNPKSLLKNLTVISVSRSKKNAQNICLTVSDGKTSKSIWAWGFGDKYEELGCPSTISLVGNVEPDFMKPGSYTLGVEQIIA